MSLKEGEISQAKPAEAWHLFPPQQLLTQCALPVEGGRDAQGVKPDAADVADQLRTGADQREAAGILLRDHSSLHQPAMKHSTHETKH